MTGIIKEVNEQQEWTGLLQQCIHYDFYHTYEYHRLSVAEEDGFCLLKYTSGSSFILLPIVTRQIPGTQYYDVTSVYGYAGPVANMPARDFAPGFIQSFHVVLQQYFLSKNIVSAFSRLHTLFDQQPFLQGMGCIKELNQTVFIDLSLPPEIQRAQYGSSTKNQTNKLRKQGFTVRKATTGEDLDAYLRIYYATMDRLNAQKSYYFSREYFQGLLEAKEFNTFILLAEKDGVAAAASMFTVCKHFMQYHLSGTDDQFLKFTPMKILLDEARLIGNEMGLQKFNLGGGYSGGNDSLFEFKSSFSKNITVFKVWRHIANEEIYQQLVNTRFGKAIPDTSFFPLYRYQ